MSEIIKDVGRETIVEYSREFVWEHDRGAGFSFPCDENGNLSPDLHPAAVENYNKCVDGTINWDGHKIIDKGIRKEVRTFRTPAVLRCNCGEEIELVNEYLGACACPVCGQWYSTFGQELLPPTMWEEDY